MLDFLGFLTNPRLVAGALAGLLAGLGAAFLLRSAFGLGVPIELLALVVAVGVIVGLVVGAWRDVGDKQ